MEELVSDTGENFSGDFGQLHEETLRSPQIRDLFDRLWACHTSQGLSSPLIADGLTRALVGALLRAKDDGQRSAGLANSFTLSPDQLRTLDAFIDENCHSKIYVKDMAGCLGMPNALFARSVRATTGQTPHQYVAIRRMARVCDLVMTTNHSLAEIALAAGFASQAHMTDVFRRKYGEAPGALRKLLRR